MSLRTAYSHALEAFIALVGSTIQAPDCIPGWLLKYWQEDLEGVAKKLNNGHGLATKLNLVPVNWGAFSEAITGPVKFDSEEKRRWVIDGFSKAWTRFAHDILNKKLYDEYNNIKHGFRVSLGGFTLAVGEEKTYGVSPPPSEMRTLGGSRFGTSFLIPEKLGNSKNHFRLRSVSRNWIPEHFLQRLCLIEMSIGNMISFLKTLHGVDPKTLKFSWPADSDGFDKPWAGSVGVTDCNMDFEIESAQLKFFTGDEIRALYSIK